MNRFVSSKVVYRDLIQCMKNRELKALDKKIHKSFKGIGVDKMFARPRKGDYGLIKVEYQLLGHRAKVILNVLDSPRWYERLLRLKMLHYMVKIDKHDQNASLQEIWTTDVGDFLFEKSEKYVQNLEWVFTDNEIEYIKAWRHLVELDRTSSHAESSFDNATILDAAKREVSISEEEEESLKHTSFHSISKEFHKDLPPIMPNTFTEICPEARNLKRWSKFWKKLYVHEWIYRHNLEAYHAFNFGSYVPCHDDSYSDPFDCSLCLTTITTDKKLDHIYNRCEVSKYWWQKLGLSSPMSLNYMIAPADTSWDNLQKLSRFVKVVRNTFLQRNSITLARSNSFDIQYPTVCELDRFLAITDAYRR